MKLKVNDVLFTKDGRKVGNSIVTTVGKLGIEITTDYGNMLFIKYTRLEELFFLGNLKEATPDHKHFSPATAAEPTEEDKESLEELVAFLEALGAEKLTLEELLAKASK